VINVSNERSIGDSHDLFSPCTMRSSNFGLVRLFVKNYVKK